MVFEQVLKEVIQLPREEQQALLDFLSDILDTPGEEMRGTLAAGLGRSILSMQGFLKTPGTALPTDDEVREDYIDHLSAKYR